MPPPTPKPRRSRRLVLLVLLCAVAGYGALQWRGNKAPGAAGFAELPEALRAKGFVGWEVVEPPDRPGPYRVSETVPPVTAPRGKSASSSFTVAGSKPRHFNLSASPEYDQAVVALDTEGDKTPTFVVLRRRHLDLPPAPSTAQKK
jgi:hypothetical protein